MKFIKTLNEYDENEIKEWLFARKIIKVENNILFLDNGIELKVIANEGCGGCNAGWYAITELNGCDNAITNVELVCDDDTKDKCDSTSYKIFVFTEDKRIKVLQVDGDDGNGFYGTGYSIIVTIKE